MRAQLLNMTSATAPNSVSASFRKKRFTLFQDLLESVGRKSVTILDVGGREEFWEVMGFTDTPHKILLLNLWEVPVRHSNFTSIAGDARDLQGFSDQSIDLVFSNSVIEHLGTWANQQRMAEEIRRVGKRYFVQTPSFFFPIEPHFLCPFYHWLPLWLRIQLIRRFSLGHIKKQPTPEAALTTLSEFRLLDKAEMRTLFPDAVVHSEKLVGLTKSYIAVKQWAP